MRRYADHDYDDDTPVEYGCEPECGYSTKSARAMARHAKRCGWLNATPEQREAWARERAEAEAVAFAEDMRRQIEADAGRACLCDADYDYVCAGCEARAALAQLDGPR